MRSTRTARSGPYPVGWALTGVSTIAIAAATLRPGSEAVGRLPLFCLFCGPYGLVDIVLNVLLFVPLGAGLQLTGLRPRVALAIVAVAPVVIELLQATVIPGRYATLHDILFNAIGGGLGVWIVARSHRLVRPSFAGARRLALLASASWIGVLAGTGWAVTVQLPDGEYYWRLAARLRGFQVFRGRILDARMVGDSTAPVGDVGADVRARLEAGTPVVVTLLPAAPTSGLAPIVQLMSSSGAKVVTVGQDGNDVVFGVLMRAGRVRLRSPSIKIERALDTRGGVTLAHPVTVRAAVIDGSLEIEVDGRSRWQRRLPLTVALGWSLILPTASHLGSETALLSGAWLALMAFPIGYYSGMAIPRSSPTAPRAVATAVCATLPLISLALGLGVIPLLTNTPAVGSLDWAGAVAGIALGWLASSSLRAHAAGRENPEMSA